MYFLFGLLLLLCLIFYFLNYCRKKRIIRKIRGMDPCEKIRILNELAEPFGFTYFCQEDILTSTSDAWQREFGYCALFDQAAPRLQMIYDCEPVCFNYEGRTWLIEFWKGQYGINTGAEIGVYRADTLIPEEERFGVRFQSVPDGELPFLSMELFCGEESLFSIRGRRWWLTGFRMGRFAEPEELTLNCSVTFPNRCMQKSFVDGMMEAGYGACELCVCGLKVSFAFSVPKSRQPRASRPALTRLASFKNRLFCRIYCRITRPFSCTPDQLLYLYDFLPFSFRWMLRLRKVPKR